MKKLLHMRRGFTLIELLIVIVIIGILAVGFAPSLLSAPKKARDAVRKGQMASIKGAIEAYALDSTTGYLDSSDCIPDDYKVNFQGSTLPVDPSGSKYVNGACKTGSYQYIHDKDNKCYMIVATMEIPENNNGKSVAKCVLDESEKTNYYVITKY